MACRSYTFFLSLIERGRFDELRNNFGTKVARSESHSKRINTQLLQLAIAILTTINDEPRQRNEFNVSFLKLHHREIKHKLILRDILYFLSSDYDKAGIYAKVLAEAVRKQILASEIPAFVKDNGGISAMLESERGRRRANPVDEQRSKMVTLRVGAACQDAEVIREGGDVGVWARIVAKPSRNGAGFKLEVVTVRVVGRGDNGRDADNDHR